MFSLNFLDNFLINENNILYKTKFNWFWSLNKWFRGTVFNGGVAILILETQTC